MTYIEIIALIAMACAAAGSAFLYRQCEVEIDTPDGVKYKPAGKWRFRLDEYPNESLLKP